MSRRAAPPPGPDRSAHGDQAARVSECQAALEQQPRRRPYFFMQPHIIIAYPPTPMRLFLRVMCGLRVGAAAAATAVQVWHVQAGDQAARVSECQAALEQQPRRRPYFFMQPHIIIAYPPTPMRLFLRVMCGLRVGAAAAATAVRP